ncbi:signal peptidase II [Actinomyces bowdenii]|uniref:Lipoprotein signal peptidase n=1 Tax=Actinomyces bowdenii TaxID=131109 RepID=A0A3P1V592_9ACTO|nr:signal peptidase II [Actinomyces bowdenii]RRD29404.1 signal peptidase II [Actinomyces bowdenii]
MHEHPESEAGGPARQPRSAGTMRDEALPVAPPSSGSPAEPHQSRPAGGAGSRRPLALLWAVALIVAVLDQATKAWALSSLEAGQRVALLGRLLGLTLVRNPGAAFSIASGQTWVFSLIAIVVSVVVMRASRRLASRSWAVALGLVLGGALGNLVDRLVRSPGILRGHVIDFIDYAGYFVGNVADIAIVAAAGGIIVLSLGGWEMDGTRSGGREATRTGESDPSAPGPRRRARLSGSDRAPRARRAQRGGRPRNDEEPPVRGPVAAGEPDEGAGR